MALQLSTASILTLIDADTIEGSGRGGLNFCIQSYTKGTETYTTLTVQCQFGNRNADTNFYDLYTYSAGNAPTIVSIKLTNAITDKLTFKINNLVFPETMKKFRVIATETGGSGGLIILDVLPEKNIPGSYD